MARDIGNGGAGMNLGVLVLAAWMVAAVVMLAVWQLQRVRGNAGIVDVAWSFMTALLGVSFAAAASGHPSRRLIVAAMAGIWGLRLGAYLWRRLLRESEDGRYTSMRKDWGPSAERRLLGFFQLQAFWAVIFALPMLAAAENTRALGWLDGLGVLVWLASISGESLADAQLARFKMNPASAGRVCDTGLWRYSRHPNYFFEWLHWWAYVCLAAGGPMWWVAVAGVAVMYLFLTRVTGIPPTEAQALRSRGDAYRTYQRTTSAFFPWVRRRAAS